MMNNSFLHPLDSVHFDSYAPKDVQEALTHTITLAKNRIKGIYAIKDRDTTFSNTVLGLTRCDEELGFVTGIVMHLESMKPSEWAQAKKLVIEEYTKFSLSVQFDQKLYKKLVTVKALSKKLEPHEQRLLDRMIKDYEDNGINLPKDTQKRLKTLSKQLTKLSSEFKPNITHAREKHPLYIKNVSALDGVNTEHIKTFAENAKETGKDGYLIPTDDGNFDVIMSSCKVKTTRRKFHKLFTSAVTKKNHEVLHTILAIRHELARILGYETPGHMLMRNRMVQDPKQAIKFVTELMGHYSEKAKKEYHDLLAYVQNTESKNIAELEQFEFDSGLEMYYPSKYFENLYQLNLEELKDYFEFNSVRNYMFATLSKLYGATFERVSIPSWHEDVEVYNIYDSEKHHIAQAHCDWFTRKDKQGHAWMNEFIIADRHVETIKPHVGCVIMNLTPATKTMPSLMSISSVETMWHEFGHFMHLAFSNTSLKEQSMMAVKWDFVEAPSQIMENWVLNNDTLPHFAKHYKTAEPLDSKVVETVKKMSLYNVGIKAIRQLYFAYVDLLIHSEMEFQTPEEMATFAKDLKEKYLPVKVMPYFATLSTFGHITGGYASGYYTYKWSESIQADLFSRFENEGIRNNAVGDSYRQQILARGDEVDPNVLVESFLGRPSSPLAMLKRDGVA